ncbi:hypothetical protein BCR42DRAFT_446731 [Absidia repens]|uniref:C2H2-type domain-containing protein n=1 Tax=Absidia repens TaxID=90262 RepID=A0A1X2IVB8_9FUNG|nr:hypothetical protein BCR42DRAFT_446731 [Absidia repens]
MADMMTIPQPREEELYCYWKDCLRPFPDHDALSHHLSEDHIGWKKREYCCEWTNCSRKGVKCHNRFALVMHLRIHTQEKPFECNIDGCNMNFGRMDALSRHKKTEHGLDTSVDMDKQGSTTQDTPIVNIKKRKGIREDYPDKQKRGKSDTGREQHISDLGESEDTDAYDTTTTTSEVPPAHTQQLQQQQQQQQKQQQQQQQKNQQHTTSSSSSSGMTPQHKYKITKAKLQYILRENEMLNDEWSSLQRRLGRLQTERRVLLDALMTAEDDQEGDLLSMDEEDDDGGDVETAYSNNHHGDTTSTKKSDVTVEKYPSSSMVETGKLNHNGYIA